jgi:DNA-binding response OmpR family regulator
MLASDDPANAGPLAQILHREGYDVLVRRDGPATLATALSSQIALIILDLERSAMDGVEVCRRLRTAGLVVPVVVLAARTDEAAAVAGLDAGADVYLTKPFRLAELLARARALLRRHGINPLEVSGVRLDTWSRRAWRDDNELSLTKKEFELLRLLLERSGTLVTRDEVMRIVWDDTEGTASKTLDMHITGLRRKLRDDPFNPKLLFTVRGVGYRFERG